MINKMDLFIQSLDIENAKNYAKNYFNLSFTDDELKQTLPLIKSYWKDYLDEGKKSKFINQLIAASTEKTANKIINIVNKLQKIYNIKI